VLCTGLLVGRFLCWLRCRLRAVHSLQYLNYYSVLFCVALFLGGMFVLSIASHFDIIANIVC
jgi:hypothetical protein